jgi:hypothetical protein
MSKVFNKGNIIESFDRDDINKREIEKDVRSRLFSRILNEEEFSKPVDLSSERSKELYSFAISENIFSFIQLQAKVCNVESIEVARDLNGPSLSVHLTHSHILSLNSWEESEVEINLDRRTWGVDEATKEDSEKFIHHFDNLCYSLEQLEPSLGDKNSISLRSFF